MNLTLLKKIFLLACLLWSSFASAVSFGGVNVSSLLGQPLSAEINLLSVTAAEQSGLSAKLASPEQFKIAGIDYPVSLPLINFTLLTRVNGETYIKLSSDQPINEPIVSLLLELNWSSGRLLREYNFLLATTAPEKSADQQVLALEPVIAPVTPVAEVVAERLVESLPVQPETKAPAEAVAEVAASTTAQSPIASSSATITVKHGDTLTKIARLHKPTDVSLERMLVALYRANAQVFDAKNMNRIQVGKILQLPASEQVASIQQVEAVTEIHAQVADWNQYRQKMAGAITQPVAVVTKQESHGKIGAAVSDQAATVKPTTKEILKLSKGEVSAGEQSTAANKKLAEEDSLAKDQALKEAQARTAVLEKNIKDMQRLAELKSQAAQVKPTAPSAVNLEADNTTLQEELTGNPIYLAGLIVTLLVLSIMVYVRPQPAVVADETFEEPVMTEAPATELVATELTPVVAEPLPVTSPISEIESSVDVEKKQIVVPIHDVDLRTISLHLDEADTGGAVPNEEEVKETIWHEVATKIDLAKAYQAMGEVAGMREILAEVMLEGDQAQRVLAQNMLKAID
ncbi:MAG: hypothetical protein RLZZ144_1047 [Pseudomonadota bacterium]